MRRTTLTTAQWWLMCFAVSAGTIACALIARHFGGYWHILVYVVLMVLISLILRLHFETPAERLTRQSASKRQYGTTFRPGSTHVVHGQTFRVMGTKYDSRGYLTIEMQRTDRQHEE